MDVEIIKDDKTFRLSEYNAYAQDFRISSPPPISEYGDIEGRDGVVDYGARLGQRTIAVTFYIKAHDQLDYPLLRDKVFQLVSGKESFYIRELRRGKEENEYIGGKRYLVRLQDAFEFDQEYLVGKSELVFITTELPYAESIGTTQDIEQNGIDSESELWGYGMGLIDEIGNYTHTGTSFSIYNAGIEIHPFQQELKITIDNVQGSTEYFELKNETNGSTFRVEEDMLDSQVVILDGPNVTSNGLNFLRRTNKEFIELSPGWNDFTISGADSAQVSFDFRFYYR